MHQQEGDAAPAPAFPNEQVGDDQGRQQVIAGIAEVVEQVAGRLAAGLGQQTPKERLRPKAVSKPVSRLQPRL